MPAARLSSMCATPCIPRLRLHLPIWRATCIRTPSCGCPTGTCSPLSSTRTTAWTEEQIGTSGGLVEIDDEGKVIRSSEFSADPAFPGALLEPYSLVVLPEIDRVVVTNSSMHEEDIFSGVTYQVWRLSDSKLMKTAYLDMGENHYGHVSPEEPRLGPDGSVSYKRSAVGSSASAVLTRTSHRPSLSILFPALLRRSHYRWALFDPERARDARLIVLDIANATKPVEVSRLKTRQYLFHALDGMGRKDAAVGGHRRRVAHLFAEAGPGDGRAQPR